MTTQFIKIIVNYLEKIKKPLASVFHRATFRRNQTSKEQVLTYDSLPEVDYLAVEAVYHHLVWVRNESIYFQKASP